MISKVPLGFDILWVPFMEQVLVPADVGGRGGRAEPGLLEAEWQQGPWLYSTGGFQQVRLPSSSSHLPFSHFETPCVVVISPLLSFVH